MRAPPEAAKQDERRLLLDRAHHAGDDAFAGRHAERAGHEAEVLRSGDDVLSVELAFADEHRVVELGVRLGILEALGVTAAVAELERVVRNRPHRHALVLAAVEEVLQAHIGRHAHVIVGARDDELVGLEVLVEDHLPGLRALHPKIVGDLALRRQEAADLRPDDVIDPIHALRPLDSLAGSDGDACLVSLWSPVQLAYGTVRLPNMALSGALPHCGN